MLIKTLMIQGFKSFNNERMISFPRGMTAIVGPNGCGKSNIVDAIRWVLGEQSPRRLRGKKMDEILFNGTEQFFASSMARVSLHFVRKERGFPHPYSELEELSVERIFFRTGESEYRINQIPVRLKDVVDLFMDTGTGTRAYSIIEQGYVGEIISAGPEKKRYFIEGAAGIVKYKARKESAARKMEATRENLRHIAAVLSEIDRQMGSLKRQAQKARRYRRIKDEIRIGECSLAFRGFRSLLDQERVDEAKREENERRSVLLSTEVVREEAEVEKIKSDLIHANGVAEETQKKLWGHLQELNQRESRQLYLKQTHEDLGKKIEENGNQVLRTKEHLAQAVCEKDLINRKIDEYAKKETWLEQAVSEARRLYDVVVSQERLLKGRVEETKEGLFALMTQKAEIHNRQLTLREKKKDLEQRKNKAVLEVEALKKEQEHFEVAKNLQEETRRNLKGKLGLLLLERTALDAHERRLRGEYNEVSTRKDQLEKALNQKNSRLQSLMELQENFEGYQDGVRAIMRGREREELSGRIRGMVADFVETEPDYELALETVLGDQLQYIVVEEQQDGLQAIQYLKAQTLGRGSFIPLHLRMDEQEQSHVDSPAVSLLDRVKIREGYQDIAKSLLRDVVFVPELKDGLALWHKNGSRRRIVTKEGDMIDSFGIVSGGRTNGSSRRLLRTKREIRELQREIDALKTELIEFCEKSESLFRKIRVNETDQERLQQDSYRIDMETLRAEKDEQRVLENLERNQKRSAVLETELFQTIEELLGCEAKESEYQDQEREVHLLHIAKESLLTRSNQELNEFSVECELCREDLSQREFDAHLAREKRSGFVSHLAEVEEKIHNIQDYLQEREKELGEAIRKKTIAGEEIEHNEEEIRIMNGIRKQLEEEVENRNAEIREQTETFTEKESKIKQLRRDLDTVRQIMDGIQLSLTEIMLKRDNLQGQIWEKHRIDITNEGASGLDLSEAEDVDIRAELEQLHDALGRIGEINPTAIEEYESLQKRYQFYLEQYEDLNRTLESLQRLIQRINRVTKSRFLEAFNGINERFQKIFPVLFNGGRAFLQLEKEDDPLESGVDIVAQPPGKKLQNLNLLSGGEKTMAALSLILAIFQYKPSPFCVLDEVDAALDDANVARFNEIVKHISRDSQFILITHNKQTMEIADTLYGITMESPGISQVVSVNIQ
jgi:chromosome segregation protein